MMRSAAGARLLSADVGLIHFDRAAERTWVGALHGRANPVAEIPRGLVTHAQDALELVSRDALPRLAHEIGGEKPLLKRQVGIVEDCPGRRRELVRALRALESLHGLEGRNGFVLATRTRHAFRPAQA